MKKESGFTLVEVIVTLVIVGIGAAVSGLSIMEGAKGYVFAKENAVTTQKAQLAIARMSREFLELSDVTSASSTEIQYVRDSESYIIRFANSQVTIDDNVLIDKVSSFTLSYRNSGGNPCQGTDSDLATIEISIDLTRADNDIGTISFTTTVNPRDI